MHGSQHARFAVCRNREAHRLLAWAKAEDTFESLAAQASLFVRLAAAFYRRAQVTEGILFSL